MQDVSELERRLGVSFHDPDLLRQALVHRSFLNENPHFPLASNERLEFLGDALIGLVAAEELFQRCPHGDEGLLTELRASVVRRESLARVGRELDLGRHLYVGRGEEASGGRQREGTLAAAIEAVVGAVLVDQGLGQAREVTLRLLGSLLEQAQRQEASRDIKSRLQEKAQGCGLGLPAYRVLAVEGQEHAREFVVEVVVDGRALGHGRGPRKADAERRAAEQALAALMQGAQE